MTGVWAISVALYGGATALAVWGLLSLGVDLAPDTALLAATSGAAVIWLIGVQWFGGRFVRPKWKLPGKLIVYLTASYLLWAWIGPWSLIFIVGHQALGWIGHIVICRQNGIDWRTSEPKEKYLEATERWARRGSGGAD